LGFEKHILLNMAEQNSFPSLEKKSDLKSILIIYGGRSQEHDFNITTCGEIVESLKNFDLQIQVLKINKDETWLCCNQFLDQEIYQNDIVTTEIIDNWLLNKTNPEKPLEAIKKIRQVDVVYLAIYGEFGEDGCMQGLLENLDLPYIGGNVIASSLGMNKQYFYKILSQYGFKIAKHQVYSKNEYNQNKFWILDKIATSLTFPVILKPVDRGLSIGIVKANSAIEVVNNLSNLFKFSNQIMVQEFVEGREFTCGVLDTDGEVRPLAISEVFSNSSKNYLDFEVKTTTVNIETPAKNLAQKQIQKIQETAVLVHQIIGCKGFSRTDMFLTNDSQIYILEINTLPGMSFHSALPVQAKALGISYADLILKLLLEAKNRERNLNFSSY
jgi:D-alanine--D-alanine ligase